VMLHTVTSAADAISNLDDEGSVFTKIYGYKKDKICALFK